MLAPIRCGLHVDKNGPKETKQGAKGGHNPKSPSPIAYAGRVGLRPLHAGVTVGCGAQVVRSEASFSAGAGNAVIAPNIAT